ncbi:hypothetical protein F3J14_16830 [Burkholderia sp. Tr-862]|uniref:hypothetical protein n=1 Tax=Burkholderia sp. Tr-862 TaxID=2608331 RepID=UPI00141A0CD3|nr:hypothetical protein [Burkholderia sp. Tr-862]NIF42519.1 hypothetical protein [Burkholderia sp. Tr-862]
MFTTPSQLSIEDNGLPFAVCAISEIRMSRYRILGKGVANALCFAGRRHRGACTMGRSDKRRIQRLTTTLYGKGVARVWRQATAGGGLIVLSPYLTSRTAEQVLAKAGQSRIYTLFDADIFGNGSSSLATVKTLMAAGHKVFCLPDLHAKIVMAPEGFASIGSQNLTQAGTRRREITATFTDSRAPAAILRMIDPWLAEAWEITSELLAAMEEEVKALFPAFKSAQAQAAEAQARFEQRRREIAAEQRRVQEELRRQLEDEQRRTEEERKRTEEDQRIAEKARQRSLTLHEGWSRTHEYVTIDRVPGEEITCTVSSRYSGESLSRLYSLMAGVDDTLLEWTANGEPTSLEREFRYLCLLEDTGAIGWARVAITRISFISADRKDYNPMQFGDKTYNLVFEGKRWGNDDGDANLVIGICDHYSFRPDVNVLAYFDGMDLEIIDVNLSNAPYANQIVGREICDWIDENGSEFRETVIPKMLSGYQPFEDRLRGAKVREFFGDQLTDIHMRVMLSHGQPFLVARRGYYVKYEVRPRRKRHP